MKTIEIPDINSLYHVNSNAIKSKLGTGMETEAAPKADNMFDAALNAAIDNINTTNDYLSDQEDEEIKLAMGQTDNIHDLTIAMQKADTSLQYTVAVRDKLLEAYREIMQMQI